MELSDENNEASQFSNFERFFVDNQELSLAREGAMNLYEENGKLHYYNESIQQYFVACVLFQYIQDYDEESPNYVPIEKSFLQFRKFVYKDVFTY